MSNLDPALLLGRWDLTIAMGDGAALPAWLEVRKSGRQTLVGQFVGTHGSARPIHEVRLHGSDFSFAIPPQWERGTENLMVTGQPADGGGLDGGDHFSEWGAAHLAGGGRALAAPGGAANLGRTGDAFQRC